MGRQRSAIRQRRRVFLGCEGESEQSYGALLGRLVEVRHRRVHLDVVPLGAGDPLAMIETAVRRKTERERNRGAYAACALLLDTDTRRRSPSRLEDAKTLARQHCLRLVWQEPCHEAVLLRHLPGSAMQRPQTSAQALADLERAWPDYRKGLAANALARRIDEAAVLRAAASIPDLQDFLTDIEFGRD